MFGLLKSIKHPKAIAGYGNIENKDIEFITLIVFFTQYSISRAPIFLKN